MSEVLGGVVIENSLEFWGQTRAFHVPAPVVAHHRGWHMERTLSGVVLLWPSTGPQLGTYCVLLAHGDVWVSAPPPSHPVLCCDCPMCSADPGHVC